MPAAPRIRERAPHLDDDEPATLPGVPPRDDPWTDTASERTRPTLPEPRGRLGPQATHRPSPHAGSDERRAPSRVDREAERRDHDTERPATSSRAETLRAIVAAVPLPVDRATLMVVHGIGAGQVFSIERESAVLGRDPEVEFFLDDPAVSRHHCRFRRTDDRYFVEDLGSANGTFLGGRRLRELQLGELFTGDRVQIGPNVVLRFSLGDRLEEQMQRRLYESATRDALTQAWSRSYLLERLEIEIASARRHGADLAMLMIEIDAFEQASAAEGPTAGGRLLQAVAARLLRQLRIEDVLARWSGAQFGVLVRGADSVGASIQAERLRNAVEELAVASPGGATQRPTVSVGVATLGEIGGLSIGAAGGARAPTPVDGVCSELVALAEARVAEASREGGNRTCATRPDADTFRAR